MYVFSVIGKKAEVVARKKKTVELRVCEKC